MWMPTAAAASWLLTVLATLRHGLEHIFLAPARLLGPSTSSRGRGHQEVDAGGYDSRRIDFYANFTEEEEDAYCPNATVVPRGRRKWGRNGRRRKGGGIPREKGRGKGRQRRRGPRGEVNGRLLGLLPPWQRTMLPVLRPYKVTMAAMPLEEDGLFLFQDALLEERDAILEDLLLEDGDDDVDIGSDWEGTDRDDFEHLGEDDVAGAVEVDCRVGDQVRVRFHEDHARRQHRRRHGCRSGGKEPQTVRGGRPERGGGGRYHRHRQR